jgi:hypothetical protein
VAATEDAKFAEVKGCRYCEKLQELVNDSLGVAYPVCCTSIGPLTPTQCLKKMLYLLRRKGRINHCGWCLGEDFYLGRVAQIRQG